MKGNELLKNNVNVQLEGMFDKTWTANISKEKLGKLFELLQAPYSNPIGSIVRETATNAWDAHVEAGNPAPIIIELNYSIDAGYSINFIDFGVGMSPERIENVYTNYLNSTKEDSNDLIGFYGIGSKSPLSYANEYFITTVYDGIEYQYIVHKSDSGIPSISLMEQNETTACNGTKIMLYINSSEDAESFIKEIENQLQFFEHVYFKNNTLIDSSNISNDFKIIKGDKFVCRLDKLVDTGKYGIKSVKRLTSYARNPETITCVIGQVSYPIKTNPINTWILNKHGAGKLVEFGNKTKLLHNLNIGLKVPIGNKIIKVTMTREEIKYNSEIPEYVYNLVNEVYEEVNNKNVYNDNVIDMNAELKSLLNISSSQEFKDETFKLSQRLSNLKKFISFDPLIMDPQEEESLRVKSNNQFIKYNNYSYSPAEFRELFLNDLKSLIDNDKIKWLGVNNSNSISTLQFTQSFIEFLFARSVNIVTTAHTKLFDDFKYFLISSSRGVSLSWLIVLDETNTIAELKKSSNILIRFLVKKIETHKYSIDESFSSLKLQEIVNAIGYANVYSSVKSIRYKNIVTEYIHSNCGYIHIPFGYDSSKIFTENSVKNISVDYAKELALSNRFIIFYRKYTMNHSFYNFVNNALALLIPSGHVFIAVDAKNLAKAKKNNLLVLDDMFKINTHCYSREFIKILLVLNVILNKTELYSDSKLNIDKINVKSSKLYDEVINISKGYKKLLYRILNSAYSTIMHDIITNYNNLKSKGFVDFDQVIDSTYPKIRANQKLIEKFFDEVSHCYKIYNSIDQLSRDTLINYVMACKKMPYKNFATFKEASNALSEVINKANQKEV